jgi:IS605 OrfB family transposase
LADAYGNPVGRPIIIPLILKGSSAKRDGHLRWAISQLLAFCKAQGATRIYIEDLNFSDGKSRESFGHQKQFRNTVSSIPTAKIKNRLRAMAARAGIELVAVDPAYTSKDSKPWIKPTSTKSQPTTSHQAASLAIIRRGLSLSLGRRKGVTLKHQRMLKGELPTGSRNQATSLRDKSQSQRRPSQGATCSPNSSPLRPIGTYLRPRTTVRRDPQLAA